MKKAAVSGAAVFNIDRVRSTASTYEYSKPFFIYTTAGSKAEGVDGVVVLVAAGTGAIGRLPVAVVVKVDIIEVAAAVTAAALQREH
jgi:hypothetical protein